MEAAALALRPAKKCVELGLDVARGNAMKNFWSKQF